MCTGWWPGHARLGLQREAVLQGVEAERQLEEAAAGAAFQQCGAADVADERGHVAGFHLCDGPGVKAVFVAERQVIEEVFDGFDSAFGEPFSDAIADAFDELDRRGKLQTHTAMLSTSAVRAAGPA